jgi:hypothetical protein
MAADDWRKVVSYTGSEPKTLMQAHDYLTRIRPTRSAPNAEWLAYYRRSAVLYAEIAEIDRGHHHEALYWASRERVKFEELDAKEVAKQQPK